MTDDKSLTGKAENVVRAVERTLHATRRTDQPGVKITNLASGKVQVEVHAYDDDITAAGDRARAEFDRQLGLASVPVDELETLRWWATIGMKYAEKPTVEQSTVEPSAESVAEMPEVDNADARRGHYMNAGPGRRRRSIVATGDNDTPSAEEVETMLAKLRQVADSGVEGVEVSDDDA